MSAFEKLDPTDELVGALALELVLERNKAMFADPDFRGAFHVLSGFSSGQLAAFVKAAETRGGQADRVHIAFPDSALKEYTIPPVYLTSGSAVDVRNRWSKINEDLGDNSAKKIVLTAEVEIDAEASLGDSDRTDASDLKEKSVAGLWVDLVAERQKVTVLQEDRDQLVAMLKGLFDTGRCPTVKVGEFLQEVVLRFDGGEPLLRAAGVALPVIGLPLYVERFTSLNERKRTQPSQWRHKFDQQYKLECYLVKRGADQVQLDPEELRKKFNRLREEEDSTPLPESVMQAFDAYIDAPGAQRSEATEELLLRNDWEYVQHCFEKKKKTSAKDFAKRTREALELEDIEPTLEDQLVFDVLERLARRPGGASENEDLVEFFERRSKALENDPKLLLEWEEFVHGKKIECTDLYQGLIQVFQRVSSIRDTAQSASIVLTGKSQTAPKSYLEKNQKACLFFERNYKSLPRRTNKAIRFENTKITQYSSQLLEKLEKKKKLFKRSKKDKRALSFDFEVSVMEKQNGGSESKIASFALTWRFAVGSVTAQEASDFDALCRFRKQRKTALAACVADYEAAGRKGIPAALCLENVDGFADSAGAENRSAGAGGRGSFVPAQQKIKSLTKDWHSDLDQLSERYRLGSELRELLQQTFNLFDLAYGEAVEDLRMDSLADDKVSAAVNAFHELLKAIHSVRFEDVRRQLLRTTLKIGCAMVRQSGNRPNMLVICPWHPIRMEALAARNAQTIDTFLQLLGQDSPAFSDGPKGTLFFHELREQLRAPLYPEMGLVIPRTEAIPCVVTQALGGYTLNQPVDFQLGADRPGLSDEANQAASCIEKELSEYLRLQPHERDNLSVLLYNCDSPDLPTAVVNAITKLNRNRDDNKLTCEVLLMHHEESHLRNVYRDLVLRGVDSEEDPTEETGDFLSRVRVNITAANKLKRRGRSKPVDLAYCRDVISRETKSAPQWVNRQTLDPLDLRPGQWTRKLPVREGDRQVMMQLACPAQTDCGWAYLHSLAVLAYNAADQAWDSGQCVVMMRKLDFDDQKVRRAFDETHDLASWVVNQDELLDRKLLEAGGVRVIRYVQRSTQGRNLVVSSKDRDTLLINTLKEKFKAILPHDTKPEVISALCDRFKVDANQISGGLVLKAARRANNTNELLGMVLSRYLVQSELGTNRPIAWCFLDDYTHWLGKKEGTEIADLLVLSPKENSEGTLHLDIVVTEAKFILHDNLQQAAKKSGKQLVESLSQISNALDCEANTIDQDLWLARLSDLLVSQVFLPDGYPIPDMDEWRLAIRERRCTVRIWGYSHVFVYGPKDLTDSISQAKGIDRYAGDALQECFGPGHVRELILQMSEEDYVGTRRLRVRNGHDLLDRVKVRSFPANRPNKEPINDGAKDDDYESPPPVKGDTPNKPKERPSNSSIDSSNDDSGAHKLDANDEDSARTREKSGGSSVIGSAMVKRNLIEHLESQSKRNFTKDAEGEAWLLETSQRLRSALRSRSLPAKEIEGIKPILTPNSAIVKLQGSREFTVQAVESKAPEIFTSEGIRIIGVSPEPGRISIAVKRPERQVLHTAPVLLRYLHENKIDYQAEKLLVGVLEETGRLLTLDPFKQPHTLIAGATGSGKSVLMQNLILAIGATRLSTEAHIYLIDPKFGVDYRPLDELGHVKNGSREVIDTPEAAIETLAEAVKEMEHRYQQFKDARAKDVRSYRRITGKSMPTLWIIHDEFADWMQTEEYRKAVPELVGRLSIKARAAGIFLIFAAQRPDKEVMPMQLRSQLGNRLILQVDNPATAEIAMGEKNAGAERLLGRGHMLAKTGDIPSPTYVQVPYIDLETEVPTLVALINARQCEKRAIAK